MACATTMAFYEGLSGSGDGTVERARLGDGLEEREQGLGLVGVKVEFARVKGFIF